MEEPGAKPPIDPRDIKTAEDLRAFLPWWEAKLRAAKRANPEGFRRMVEAWELEEAQRQAVEAAEAILDGDWNNEERSLPSRKPRGQRHSAAPGVGRLLGET